MSRIFTFEDVQKGRFPSPDNFQHACHFAARALEFQPGIRGGMFFGSTALRKYGVASDINLALVIVGSPTSVMERIAPILLDIELNHYVKFSILTLRSEGNPKRVLETANLTRSLFEHLKSIKLDKPVLTIGKGVPIRTINPEAFPSFREELSVYLKRTSTQLALSYLAPQWTDVWRERNRLILDAPVYAARRYLQARALPVSTASVMNVTGSFIAVLEPGKLKNAAEALFTEHLGYKCFMEDFAERLPSITLPVDRWMYYRERLIKTWQYAGSLEIFCDELQKIT